MKPLAAPWGGTCPEGSRLPSHSAKRRNGSPGMTREQAYVLLNDIVRDVLASETVVIQGTGGVSIFALQFAKLLGSRVIGTSSSDEKLKRAIGLGLDTGCNYKERPDWSKWVIETTEGLGADRIIEVGGANTFGQSLKAARVAGMVAQIGILSGAAVADSLALTPILHKQLQVQGIYVGSRAMFEEMNAAIAKAKLRPVIDRVFAANRVRDAFLHMQSASHFGKIVIRTAES